ncbi:MAG: peptide deformylase [Gammaproteobacteria bacterium]
MARLSVLHFPDPRLRQKAVAVDAVDETVQSLARDMLETMYAEGGIGLAATQVNVQKRLVVMDLSEQRDEPLILINPEILVAEVCVQHEIDHLDGKLFIDYLSPLKRQRIKKKLEKQEKQKVPAL